jgi:transposase
MATYRHLHDPLIHAFTSSTLTMTNEGLSVTMARSMWTPHQWNTLVALVLSFIAQGISWMSSPSWIPPIPGQPRWKRLSCDGLTRLLFALLIAPTHPLRPLFDAFDWAWIDGQCAPPYRNRHGGAPAYAPQMLFRVLVLMFVSGTPFESATLRRLETDVAWRWFVGLNLWCRVPDAGTLSRFRSRVGVDRFEQILTECILVCDRAGLIGHSESYYDMTGVAASATQTTPYQRAVILSKALSVWLDEDHHGIGMLDREQIATIAIEVLSTVHPSLKTVAPSQLVASQDAPGSCVAEDSRAGATWWQRLMTALARQPRLVAEATKSCDTQLRQVAQAVVPDVPQAFGDQEASVGHTRTDGSFCGYRSGFLVDAKRRIITAVIVGGSRNTRGSLAGIPTAWAWTAPLMWTWCISTLKPITSWGASQFAAAPDRLACFMSTPLFGMSTGDCAVPTATRWRTWPARIKMGLIGTAPPPTVPSARWLISA